LSADFWINLLVALSVFLIGIGFINRSKIEFIRKIRARYLRSKIIPKIQALLPIIAQQLQSDEPDLFPIFRLKADLESVASRSQSLFFEEREAVNYFLATLSSEIARFEAGNSTDYGIDELVLSGQRAITELVELGNLR